MHPCMLRAHAYNRLKLEKIYCSRLQLIFSYGFLRDHMQKSFFFHAGHLKYWHVKITVFLTKRLFNSPAYKNPPCLPILFFILPSLSTLHHLLSSPGSLSLLSPTPLKLLSPLLPPSSDGGQGRRRRLPSLLPHSSSLFSFFPDGYRGFR